MLPPRNGAADRPLLPEVGVIGLVPDVWGGPWASRHQILTRLARLFNVVWMERPHHWREWWLSGVPEPPSLNPEVPAVPGFHIYRPGRWLPLVHRKSLLTTLASRLRISRATRMLRAAGARRFILYLWHPDFDYALDAMPGAISCYHVYDEYSFSTTEQPVSPQEAALLGRVDQVVFHSPGLWERKSSLAPGAALVPNGGDYQAYSTPAEEPADLRDIPRPRLGYVGAIKDFLDLPLMLELARQHPQWSLVLVGPFRSLDADQATFEELRRLPNVRVLGPRPVAALPGYMQHIDVGLMPYDVNDYTKFINPLKLNEYLAAGIPVVSTPIRSVLDFRGVVTIARGPAEWSAAVEEALQPGARAAAAVAERRDVARRHDWNTLTRRIAGLLAERLGGPWPQRVGEAAERLFPPA